MAESIERRGMTYGATLNTRRRIDLRSRVQATRIKMTFVWYERNIAAYSIYYLKKKHLLTRKYLKAVLTRPT